MTKSFTLSMNGSFDGVVEDHDHDDDGLYAPGSDKHPNWTASDEADRRREQRLHGLRRTPELGLLPVSEATLAARGIDNSCGWTASDVAEHNREKRLHGHRVH